MPLFNDNDLIYATIFFIFIKTCLKLIQWFKDKFVNAIRFWFIKEICIHAAIYNIHPSILSTIISIHKKKKKEKENRAVDVSKAEKHFWLIVAIKSLYSFRLICIEWNPPKIVDSSTKLDSSHKNLFKKE